MNVKLERKEKVQECSDRMFDLLFDEISEYIGKNFEYDTMFEESEIREEIYSTLKKRL